MCVSVIEVAEAAGEHNDLFGETLSNFFDIPDLHLHHIYTKIAHIHPFNLNHEKWFQGYPVKSTQIFIGRHLR